MARKQEIKKSIRNFEKHNKIRLRKYCTHEEMDRLVSKKKDDEEMDHLPSKKIADERIAKSEFYKKVTAWNDICQDDESSREFLKLLSEFNYFTRAKYEACIYKLVSQI